MSALTEAEITGTYGEGLIIDLQESHPMEQSVDVLIIGMEMATRCWA